MMAWVGIGPHHHQQQQQHHHNPQRRHSHMVRCTIQRNKLSDERQQQLHLERTLKLLYVTETLVLTEYLEISIPISYCESTRWCSR